MNLYRYVALLFAVGFTGIARSQTFTPVYLHNPTFVSGTSSSLGKPLPGTIYKYSNVTRSFSSGGTKVDAFVQFVRTSNYNNAGTTAASNLVGLHTFDVPASVNSPGGYDSAFQAVTSVCNKTNTGGIWTRINCIQGNVDMNYNSNQNYLCHFRISFKKAGTNLDTALNVRAAFIDIDGFGSGTEAEQNAFMPGISYALAPSTTLTMSTRPSDGMINALGRSANVGGINLTSITAITQVTYLNRTFIDFAVGMRTNDDSQNGGCYDATAGGRLSSVSFSQQPTGLTVITPTADTLRGTVWDDANNSGTTAWTNIQNGTEAGTNGDNMYVYAIEAATGTIVDKATVAANGTYTIIIPKGMTIRMVLSAENVVEGATNVNLVGTVNSGWVATTPQLRPQFAVNGNMSKIDWGVEEIPVVNAYTVARQLNPGGANRVSVPNAAFTGSDAEDGPYGTGLIGKKVRLWKATNGDVYYNGTIVSAPTDFANFNPALVTVDPQGSAVSTITTTFDYATYDAGNVIAVQKTVTLPFEAPIKIKGNVWDDANGDAIKVGSEPYTNAGGLNAVLLSSSGAVLEVEAVASNGSYILDQSISATNYQVLITTANPGLGTTLNTSALPAGWVHTGVNLVGTPNTGNKTGIISGPTGPLGSADITGVDFGIEQIPSGADYTATRQLNPGGTVQVTVPTAAFTGTDPEDGNYNNLSGRKVTLIPAAGGDLYYNGTQVPAAGQTIASFNPTQVKVDPAGTTPTTVTTSFNYQVFDNADVPSVAKTIRMPFEAPILISGYVWDDANGNAVKASPEAFTNAGGLNAVLVSSGNVVIEVEAVNAATGAYSFDQAISGTSYSVILTTANPAQGSQLTTSTLPGNGAWVNTGVNISGTANVANKTGIIAVTTGAVGSASLTDRNFGIEQIPSGADYTAVRQLNPGGTTQVTVPAAAFTGTDPEDGNYNNLSGRKVTLIPAAGGDLYYNGTQVPAAGQTIASFNPAQVAVDPAGTTPATVTTTFRYQVFDNANVPSVAKTIAMPFEAPVIISGYVWVDGNGNASKQNNEPYTNAGGVNAVLTSSNGTVIEVEAVDATTGAFSFNQAVSSTSYKIVITTATPAINSTLTASSLAGVSWMFTGTNNSSANPAADKNNRTGIISLTTTAAGGNMGGYGFGVQQTPTVVKYTKGKQRNPGGNIQIDVPRVAFMGSDPEDGVYPNNLSGQKVTLTPGTGGDLYYNRMMVAAAGITLASFDPGLVSVDPAGTTPTTVTTTFSYLVFDSADAASAPETVTLPFEAPIVLSGNVWNDVNADAIKASPELFTNAGGLYAVLTGTTGEVLEVESVNATTGAYAFDQPISATAYKIILSTTAPALGNTLTASSLPAPATGAWINTGTNIAGTPNTGNRSGIISVTTGAVGSAAIGNLNFGIEQLPLAGVVTAAGRPNPGDTLSVVVPPATFTGSDNDGVISNIRITAFPTNATSIQVGTTRYYPAASVPATGSCPVGATCTAFPAPGLTIPANTAAPGQPGSIVRVDPINGSVVVSIPFKTIDNGNQESALQGSANVPFYAPLPPVAQNVDNEPINSSAPQTHIGGFVASDPQGDPILSYTVLTLPPANTGVLYTCSSNSVPCTGTYAPVTVNQVLTPAQSQTLYFRPDSAFIGTTTFTYNATSKNGISNTAIESIPVVNNPPTANSFTTDPVKRNSSNNPVPPLSGTDGDGIVVTYTVTPPVPSQGTLTYCTTPPAAGCGTPITTPVTLTPEQVKYISYTPAPDYTGTTTFTYTTKDNNNLVSEPATVYIPVTNLGLDPRQLPPVTQNITLAPLNSASPAVLIPQLLGSDPDGTIASYKLLSVPATTIGVLYVCSNGTFPCTGSLSAAVVNQTLTPDQATTLQFDPTAGNNNTPASFRYSATDNDNLVSNTSTYTIPVTNQPPTAIAIQTRVPFNTTNYPVPPLQGLDADGTVQTYRIRSIPNPVTEGRLFTCSSNSIPCTGTYTPVNVNAELTPAQISSLTFTPATNFTGTVTGSYDVRDDNQKWSNVAPITLKIDNFYQQGLPPIAVGSSYAMGANDGTAILPGSFISAKDPDGTITSFTITSLPPVSQGVYAYCTTPPATNCNNPLTVGQTLTPAQAGALRFTPNETYSGPSYLGFFATDNDGNLSNLAVSVVDVTSKPPVATGYTTAAVKSGGSPIATPLLATDYLDNGRVVSYTVTSIPNKVDGSLSYCSNPPSTGCNTPIVVGTKLTPDQANTVRFTPGANISVHELVFNFTATDNSNNLSNVASIVVPVLDPLFCIKVRAYVEGALINNGGQTASDGRPLMRDNLRVSPFTNANYIPVRDPYEFATPFVNVTSRFIKYPPQTADYPAFQQVMDSTAVFRVSGQDAIVDWAFVELRDKRNLAQVYATRAGLLQRDGDIVDVDGVGCLAFPDVPVDSYFVSVRHRSHLGTLTKYGQSAANLQTLVDMTVPATPLYDRGTVSGFNFAGLSQKANVSGTYRAMWQGDFNADGKVKYDNPNDDLSVMLFDVLNYPTNANRATNYDFAYGYRQGDYDMNSKVKYDNPNDDNSSLLFQLLGYPLNVNRATNFDFLIQQLPNQ